MRKLYKQTTELLSERPPQSIFRNVVVDRPYCVLGKKGQRPTSKAFVFVRTKRTISTLSGTWYYLGKFEFLTEKCTFDLVRSYLGICFHFLRSYFFFLNVRLMQVQKYSIKPSEMHSQIWPILSRSDWPTKVLLRSISWKPVLFHLK